MSDFNDEPLDTSLVVRALRTRQRRKVLEADIPRLWNLTWPPMGTPDGSFYFDNQPNQLEQFLVNRSMAADDWPIRADPDSVTILRSPDTVSTGKYPKPRPFGGMGNPVDETGYSDHFPIGMTVTEED